MGIFLSKTPQFVKIRQSPIMPKVQFLALKSGRIYEVRYDSRSHHWPHYYLLDRLLGEMEASNVIPLYRGSTVHNL